MSRQIEWLPLGSLPAPSRESEALCRELAPLVGGRASIASQDRISYARDMWPGALLRFLAGEVPKPPEVIVWPDSTQQVAALTRRARQLGVPLVPYGGGSGVCGGTLALRGGIVVDLKRMNRVLAIDRDQLEVEAEAGIVGEVLERRLARKGLSTGHFPGSMRCSTLGGWLATRSAGQASNRYGKIEDMVATLTAVDGRGEILTPPRRPVPGWDQTRALLGSEGALATICSARLHVVPRPEARAFVSQRFGGLREGLEAIRAMYRAGIRPAVVRLYDPLDTLIIADHEPRPASRPGAIRGAIDERLFVRARRLASRALFGSPGALNRAAHLLRESMLVMVFEGPADLVEIEAEEAARIGVAAGGDDRGPEPARAWFENRYAVSFKQSAAWDAGAFVDTLEVAATWERVGEVYRSVREALRPLAFVMCHFSHAWLEGCCLYFTFAGAAGELAQAERRYEEIWRAGLAAANAAGATVSHHHGVGVQRRNALKAELGDGMRLVRALKATFDPDGIMNPGKLGV